MKVRATKPGRGSHAHGDRRGLALLASGVVLLAVAACATGAQSRPTAAPKAGEASPPPASEVELSAASLDQTKPPGSNLIVRLPDGKLGLRRAELARIQKEGPHWLLQRVKVRPQLKKGRFIGWRISSYTGPGKLDPGDIVQRVNGRSVERPDQFIEVWNKMASQDKLVIRLIRAGKRVHIELPLVGK